MKPILVIDNSAKPPPRTQVPEGSPETRIALAWRCMQFVMDHHTNGTLTDGELIELLYAYLDDEQLNTDLDWIERPPH
jgi:hypothetical protein